MRFTMRYCTAGLLTVWLLAAGLSGCQPESPAPASGPGESAAPTSTPSLSTEESAAPENTVREIPLEVSAGEYPLPALLTLPAGEEKAPAVILLHGSGASDMDETVYENRPFQDLAQGLAERGIAVLRYDKRVYRYREAMLEIPCGVEEDALQDAQAAFRLLQGRPEIDPARIYFAGHSQGGGFTGVLAQREPEACGVICLAGTPRRLEDITYEQFQRAGLSEDQLAAQRAVVEAIKALDDKEDPDPFFYYWGASELYWKTLNALDVPGDMRRTAESRPVLILQGERDCQVFMEDFALWKELLGPDNPQVTYRSYPELNHYFLPGQGDPNAEEYRIPGHIPDEVLYDIARWILQGTL